jgi:hypothetical protein
VPEIVINKEFFTLFLGAEAESALQTLHTEKPNHEDLYSNYVI